MKRTISAGIVLLLLLLMTTASASTAGTADDPLVTLSYLSGAYAQSLKTDASKALGEAVESATGMLDELYAKYLGYSFVRGFTRMTLAANDTVLLSMGGSFILRSGSATLTSVNGTVINISTGREAAEGEPLAVNQRYFCAEDTVAVITAATAAVGLLDGYFYSEKGVLNRPHYVFVDIMEDDWYYAAVEFVYTNAIYSGTSANTFSPGVAMTRGMLVTVLYNIEKRPAAGEGGRFTDVRDPTTYYYDAVTWASENGIVQGYGDGAFRPDIPITREQMATLFYQYAVYKQKGDSAPGSAYDTFPDRTEVSDFAVAAFRWAVSHGIVNGSNGRLLPSSTATRAEVAQMVKNYMTTFG